MKSINRRQFLSLAAATPLLSLPWATSLSASTGAALQPSKLLVMIYLKGGNDGYNTFVPLNDPRYRKFRPNIALPRESLIPFSATHGFNAALKPLLAAWENKEMAVLQGIGQDMVSRYFNPSSSAYVAVPSSNTPLPQASA